MKNIKVMDLRVFFLPNLSQDNKIFFNHLRYELHAPETKILQTSIDTLDYKNKYQSTRDKTDSRLSYIIRYVISVHLKSVQKCRSYAIWRFYIFSLALYREYQVANLLLDCLHLLVLLQPQLVLHRLHLTTTLLTDG